MVRRTVEGYSRVYSKKRNNGGRFSSSGSGSNYYLFDESDESMVYGWMLRLQDYHKKEIAAYLVRKGNGKKGILLLPWQNNTSSSSWIDYPNTLSGTISDNYGNTYETLAVVHTHPIFNGESPLEAVRPSDDDVRIIGHLGIPGYIITNKFYLQVNPNLKSEFHKPASMGLTEYLTTGTYPISLFPK